MKLLFIGGTRFIGLAAAEDALGAGHDVFLIHRGVHRSEIERATIVIADRNDADALKCAVQQIRPAVVVDTRSMTLRNAECVSSAVAGAGAHLVVLSSHDVYSQFGRMNGLPAVSPEAVVTEESPLTIPYPFRTLGGHAGGWDYDKKDVEGVFKKCVYSQSIPGATILRLPPTYGVRDYYRRFGAVVDRLDAGGSRLPTEDSALWKWTHGHVRDVARAIVLSATVALEGCNVFNVGELSTPTMRERVERIAGYLGCNVQWEATESVPEDLDILRRMPNDCVVDSSRIRQRLGFVEVTTEQERISDLVSWLRASRGHALETG